jgi:predicted flap endonuclease-1-like 5' DNA nuclease
MLRRLFRLLIIGLLLAIAAYVVSRLMGGDEDDFDDFDDLDSDFEFQETPVEIDLAATEAVAPSTNTPAAPSATNSMGTLGLDGTQAPSDNAATTATATDGGRLIDINGIGPAYEARLHSIGINSIHDLADADPDMIASQIEVIGGATTVGDWIDQARSYHSNGQS